MPLRQNTPTKWLIKLKLPMRETWREREREEEEEDREKIAMSVWIMIRSNLSKFKNYNSNKKFVPFFCFFG